jgi:membrane protease YdiL (CAAX protease family)
MEQYNIQPDERQTPSEPSEIVNPVTRPPIWGTGPTIGFGVVVFVASMIVQILVVIGFAVAQYISNPELDPLNFAESLASNGLLLAVATIASGIAGIGFIVLFIAVRKGTHILDYLGLRTIPKKSILVFLAICIGLIGLSALVNIVFNQEQDSGFTIDAYRTSVWPVLFWIAAVIFAPAFEEAFFRGFLFVGLKQSRLGTIGTIVLTALAWALLHIQYDAYGMTTILVLGIILGIVRVKTNSLWGPLIIHSSWNLVAMVGAYLYVNGIGT